MNLADLIGGIVFLHFTPIPWVIYWAVLKYIFGHDAPFGQY